MNKRIHVQRKSVKQLSNDFKAKIYEFDLNRCDKRTFYVTINLEKDGDNALCDLIFLIDKQELFGAISLNSKYDEARKFFKTHFDHDLLYSDELYIANQIKNSPEFSQHLNTYALKYPTHMKEGFFK